MERCRVVEYLGENMFAIWLSYLTQMPTFAFIFYCSAAMLRSLKSKLHALIEDAQPNLKVSGYPCTRIVLLEDTCPKYR